MARRRSRRRQSNSAQAILVVVLALVLVSMAGGVGYYYWRAISSNPEIDEATLCPISGPTSQTIALIDTTDPMPVVTQSEVLSRLKDVTSQLERGALFEVRVLNEDPSLTRVVQSLCNPGSPDEIDPLISNPDRARRRWEERFSGPIEVALANSMSGSAQSYSPILAAVQQIAAERLSTSSQRDIETRILVISDLIEHTDFYSHYTHGPRFADYERIAGARYFTRLYGSTLEFWMISRGTRVNETELGDFWLTWAEGNGGHARVVRMMGQ